MSEPYEAIAIILHSIVSEFADQHGREKPKPWEELRDSAKETYRERAKLVTAKLQSYYASLGSEELRQKIASLHCEKCYSHAASSNKCLMDYPIGECPGYYEEADQILSFITAHYEQEKQRARRAGYDEGVEDRLGLEDAQTQTIKRLKKEKQEAIREVFNSVKGIISWGQSEILEDRVVRDGHIMSESLESLKQKYLGGGDEKDTVKEKDAP